MKNCFYLILSLFLLATVVHADIPRTMYILNGSAETVSKMTMDNITVNQDVLVAGAIPNQIVAHNGLIYVVNSGTDNIQVISPVTDEVVETIALPTGSNPWAIAFTGASKAYVTNYIANTVSVIDLSTGSITKDIPVGKSPEGVVVLDNQAFVTNTGYAGWGAPYVQGTVSVIDILADSVTHTLPVPTNPQNITISPDGNLHVTCTGNYADQFGKIAAINLYTGPSWNTPAVVDTFIVGGSPAKTIVTDAGKAYCVAWGDGVNGHLYSYDVFADTVTHNSDNPLLVGPNVSDLVYDKKENAIWIPYMAFWGGDGFVQKFDLTTESITWNSPVVGNGTSAATILEPMLTVTPWADAVAEFTPGIGAGFGANYFPENILGAPTPDPAISAYNPSTSPQEILSLGNGGEIVLEFTDNYITDEEGVDFTVFENVFLSFMSGMPYIEAGIVSVSQDGENFVTFPYDTSDFSGMAGVSPTLSTLDYADPTMSGGDQFDLADVGLAWAKYVKITDLGDIKKEGSWNGDFDLDAVVAIHSVEGQFSEVVDNSRIQPEAFTLAQNYPNPFNPETTIRFSVAQAAEVKINIYNLQGQRVKTLVSGIQPAGQHQVIWNGRDNDEMPVASGMYIYELQAGQFVEARQMLLLK